MDKQAMLLSVLRMQQAQKYGLNKAAALETGVGSGLPISAQQQLGAGIAGGARALAHAVAGPTGVGRSIGNAIGNGAKWVGQKVSGLWGNKPAAAPAPKATPAPAPQPQAQPAMNTRAQWTPGANTRAGDWRKMLRNG